MRSAVMEVGIGTCLRELRESAKWRQVDLARLAGISATALSRIETGKRRPDLAEVQRLISLLGYTADSSRLLDTLMQRGCL